MDKEKRNKSQLEYRKKNREKISERSREHYERNKGEMLRHRHENYENNKEKLNEKFTCGVCEGSFTWLMSASISGHGSTSTRY